jgi:P pilus assembly chaperone PapD
MKKDNWSGGGGGGDAAAADAIALTFHQKHVTNKNKTKYIMKISHISVNIYDKKQVNKIVIKMLIKREN